MSADTHPFLEKLLETENPPGPVGIQLPAEHQERMHQAKLIALGENHHACKVFDIKPDPGARRLSRAQLVDYYQSVHNKERLLFKVVQEALHEQGKNVNKRAENMLSAIMHCVVEEMDCPVRRITAKSMIVSWHYDWDDGVLSLHMEVGFNHYGHRRFFVEQFCKTQISLNMAPRRPLR